MESEVPNIWDENGKLTDYGRELRKPREPKPGQLVLRPGDRIRPPEGCAGFFFDPPLSLTGKVGESTTALIYHADGTVERPA
jgi:hypothetical protein